MMNNTTIWQLLFVDDDAGVCERVKEYLEGESIATPDERPQVQTLTDFTEALEALEKQHFDLLILDVRVGSPDEEREEEVGIRTLEAIKQRRFVPVVFYTALPHLVQNLETPFIRVVEKEADPTRLLETMRSIFATQLPTVNRALIRHLETVQRDYMWDFVATHWEQFGYTPDRASLAYLLARRLAISLSGPGIRQLAQELGDVTGTATVEDQIHPMQYYVMPPIEKSLPLAGDLYKGQIEAQDGYWVLLTPSCDFVVRKGKPKVEWALMAYCVPLNELEEYRNWLNNPSKVEGELKSLLRNNRANSQPERFFFLPGAIDLPDLVVDFQQLVSLPREQMDNLERLASLDSPFAEALLARFSRYFGRLGTPDLDLEVTLNRLLRR